MTILPFGRAQRLRFYFMVAALLSPLWAGQAAVADESFDAATRAAIRDVISRQLDAFAHDDAKAAEAFAAPQIKARFPEPDQFLAMVKKNYPALVRPKRTTFGEIAASPHGPLQQLTVVDSDGTMWNAVYVMAQVEGAWRIIGCVVAKPEGQDI